MRAPLTLGLVLLFAACHREPAPPTTPPPPPEAPTPQPPPAPDVALAVDAALVAPPDATDAADDAPLRGPLRVGFYYDMGMRHAGVSAVLLRGEAIAGQRDIVRVGGGCRAADYARLMGHPPAAPVVVATGCVNNEPDLRVSHVIEVLREGDALVLRHGDARNHRVASWEEVGRVVLAPGAEVSAETPAAIEAAMARANP